MGSGVLMSRGQADAAMAAATARARGGGCGDCPPSPPNGGVTGSKPATGPSPSGGGPTPRQSALNPRPTPADVARATGNTPCGGNRNASSNIARQGYTSNPNVLPISTSQLTARPVSPYTDNPLTIPSGRQGGRPATDGQGNPTNASQTTCAPCDNTGGMGPVGSHGQDYGQGYNDGASDPGAEPHPYGGQSAEYYQGYADGFQSSHAPMDNQGAQAYRGSGAPSYRGYGGGRGASRRSNLRRGVI